MIKNERQYRITKSQLERFQSELCMLNDQVGATADLHRSANQAIAEDLQSQINEYEALRDGGIKMIAAESLNDLPRSLIRARIAQRMTQKDLAAKVGVKEQQIQRWESDEYKAASLETLKSVVSALDLQTSTDFLLPLSAIEISGCTKRLEAIGVDKTLLARILTPDRLNSLKGQSHRTTAILQSLRELGRVLGFTVEKLLNPAPLPPLVVATARFKTSSNASAAKVHAFAVYAHYVAAVTVEAAKFDERLDKLPKTWQEMRAMILENFGHVSFSTALKQAWKCGIVVIPMRCAGAFHGAVWQIKGSFVVVLKQNTVQSARWLFDLLHEMAHAANGHVTEDQAVIEEQPIGFENTNGNDEETFANEWAEDILFDGRSQEIELACMEACRNNLRRLASVVPSVAEQYVMDTGALANHLAWRLASQGQNWWGAAENLQKGGPDPFIETCTELCAKLNLAKINPFDRDMLLRAISTK